MSIARLLNDLDEYNNRDLEQEIERMETEAAVLRERARTLRYVLKGRLSIESPESPIQVNQTSTVVVQQTAVCIETNGHPVPKPEALQIESAAPEPEGHWSDLLEDIEPQIDAPAAAKQAIAERQAREAHMQPQAPMPFGERRGRAEMRALASQVALYLQAAGPTKLDVICKEAGVPKMTIVGLLKRDGRFVKTGHGIYGLKR